MANHQLSTLRQAGWLRAQVSEEGSMQDWRCSNKLKLNSPSEKQKHRKFCATHCLCRQFSQRQRHRQILANLLFSVGLRLQREACIRSLRLLPMCRRCPRCQKITAWGQAGRLGEKWITVFSQWRITSSFHEFLMGFSPHLHQPIIHLQSSPVKVYSRIRQEEEG